jgi:hypothetical protein
MLDKTKERGIMYKGTLKLKRESICKGAKKGKEGA